MGPEKSTQDIQFSTLRQAIRHPKEITDGIEANTFNQAIDVAKEARNSSDEVWEPPQPSSDSIIWRYVNFTQLQSILERNELWFSNIDNFNDPYEGTLPQRNLEKEVEAIASEMDISEEDAQTIHSSFINSRGSTISNGYVNCWNISNHESAALWEQYLDSAQGVAICTTVDGLQSALYCSDIDVKFGKVEYIDYERDQIPGGELPPLFHKRKSFKHEKEFRACITSEDDSEAGRYVDVDVSKLVDTIYLSPTSQNWFKELVSDVLETYDLECELKKSDVYSDPVF